MSDQLMYLKEDCYFEPLINHWYGWSFLIPPVQASRYIANTHKRIMNSFIKNTQLHIIAAKQPTMTGGEFLNARADQVDDVKKLVDEMETHHGELLLLSDAVKELDDLIRAHVNGGSIEYLYEKVPERLKGFVEITLDINHNAGYRLIEPLLYASSYYDKSLQSLSFGLLSKVDERPFCFSTPRLADENHLQMALDFAHPDVEKILQSRTKGIARSELERIFSSAKLSGGLTYPELFTDEAPVNRLPDAPTDDIQLIFLGHASFMIKVDDLCILIDPVIPARGESYADDVFSYSDLPEKIDYICVTHNHLDHFNLETLLQLRHKTQCLVLPVNNGGTLPDPSMKLIAEQLGFQVLSVDDFDHIKLPCGKITALPFIGEHGDLNVRSKTVWFVELYNRTFFFGADATNSDPELYKRVRNITGDVDVLAIGMECVGAPYTWLYGALNTQKVSKEIKDSRRLNGANSEQAMNITKVFNAKEVFLYAMGMEPWYKYFMGVDYQDESPQIIESDKLLSRCKEVTIPCERLVGKKILTYGRR